MLRKRKRRTAGTSLQGFGCRHGSIKVEQILSLEALKAENWLFVPDIQPVALRSDLARFGGTR